MEHNDNETQLVAEMQHHHQHSRAGVHLQSAGVPGQWRPTDAKLGVSAGPDGLLQHEEALP